MVSVHSLLILLVLLQAEERDARLMLLAKVVALSVIILGFFLVVLFLMKRMFREARQGPDLSGPAAHAISGPTDPAFAMATFQAVIQRMREQEKELEAMHRAARDKARQSEQLSANIMRNMATGLVMLNAQGLITESNPAAKAVLGHQLLEGRSFLEVFSSRDGSEPSPILEKLGLCLREGQTFRRVTMAYRAPGGETKVLGVGMSPIVTEEKPAGAICLLSDLTEITLLQQQVRLKENLAALGEMSAGIAHEFKNSLATISGYAQLIRAEDALDGAHKHAARIVAETQFLTQIVTDFLNFSRPLNLIAGEVGVRDLIENTFAEIRERGDFPGVRLELAGEFPTVSADQTLLRQCISNLLRNGCEAIAEAGRPGLLRVEGHVEKGETGPVLRLGFSDNGTGIARENLDKVFIPFFTTKNAGTGLGLALVHKIVVNHNGKIQVASESGKGTTFTITLPLAHPAGAGVS